MLLQRLPISTRLSREPSTMQFTRPRCSSDPQSPPSVSGRLNWASPCTPPRSSHGAAESSARFPCSVHRHRRLAIYTPSGARTCIRISHRKGSYIGFYRPCDWTLQVGSKDIRQRVQTRQSLQSLNEPGIGECLVRPWSSLVYDISLPIQRSAER